MSFKTTKFRYNTTNTHTHTLLNIYFTFYVKVFFSVNILFITIQTQNKAHLNIFKFQLVEASTDNRVLPYTYTSQFSL